MSTVFILVDALRHDYPTLHGTAPFLSQCAAEALYVRRVRPSLGYCERVEILTGVGFPSNGFLTAIGRDTTGRAPYSWLRYLPQSVDRGTLCRKLLGRFARSTCQRLSPYHIPFRVLSEMALTEDATDHRQVGAFAFESLVETYAEAGLDISWHFTALGHHNGSDSDRLAALLDSLSRAESDLYMLYLGALDGVGHVYGPESNEVANALRVIDRQVKQAYQALIAKDPKGTLVVLGDHGMASISTAVDAGTALRSAASECGLRLWRDYTYFLDSTMLRIWGLSGRFSARSRTLMSELTPKLGSYGTWLAGEWDRGTYGEHVWLCREGVMVFPDFFHRHTAYQGMHGYDARNESMHGMAVVYSDTLREHHCVIPEGQLADVANTLCHLAGVRPPRNSSGTSWLAPNVGAQG